MRIPIVIAGKEFFITADEHQFVLGKESPMIDKETGQPGVRRDYIHFFSTLEGLFKFLLNQDIKGSEATTLQELMADLAKSRDKLKAVFGFNFGEECDK